MLEEIMAKNFPNLVKHITLAIQESENRQTSDKVTQTHHNYISEK
jgi:hypothetical protein